MPDTKVNTADTDRSHVHQVVKTAGGHVVIWGEPQVDTDVVSRRYDANGVADGVTMVNTVTDGRQANYLAAQLSNGGYVVVWTDQPSTSPDDFEIRARIYDGAGAATGSQVNLTQDVNTTSRPLSVSGLAGGGFVMAWRTTTGQTSVDYVGRFSADGVRLDATQLTTVSGGVTSVAGLAGGGFVVLRSDSDPDAGTGATLSLSRFNAEGVQQGSSVVANPEHLFGPRLPSAEIAPLAGGGFVVTWVGVFEGDADIYMRQFDASGAPVTAETHVNTVTASAQRSPSVIALPDGGYFIVWTGSASNGFGQRYDAAGQRIGSEFLITTDLDLRQDYVHGAALEDGHVVFSWRSTNLYGPSDVYQTVLDIVDGTANGETLIGSSGRDIIYGMGGGDTLNGGADVDILDGGTGDDTLNGGADADILYGLTGDDTLNGGGGDDILDGGAGNDAIIGGGAATRDTVSYASATAGVTVDLVAGTATGGAGNDTLTGIRDIIGSSYADNLTSIGHGGILRGGAGDDVFHFGGSAADAAPATTFDGGAGMDMVSFAEASGAVAANLVSITISAPTLSGWHHAGNITSIEGFIGSGYGDTLIGNFWANTLRGEDGNDKLYGQGGDDALEGGDVDDILDGGAGADFLSGGAGTDQLFGLEGNDVLVGGGGTSSAPDYFYGGAGDDIYYVASTLSSPLDLVFEGTLFAGSEAGLGDVDSIHSTGQHFWDYYSVGEYLYIDNAIAGGAYLVGGKDVANKVIQGSSGTDYISTYGRNARVDAGAGTDAISFNLYGLDESYRGANTVVMKAGSGTDYVHSFRSGTDHIDLTAFHFGITGQQVLDQAVNVDNAGTADDYCYFYLTNAGGVDNFVIFMGLLSNQLQASDFII